MAIFEGVCQISLMENRKNCSETGEEKERGQGYLKSHSGLVNHFFQTLENHFPVMKFEVVGCCSIH